MIEPQNDSGATNLLGNVADNSDLDKRLLAEYRVISSALERLEKGYESVEQNIALLQQRLPQTVRCAFHQPLWVNFTKRFFITNVLAGSFSKDDVRFQLVQLFRI